MKHTWITTAALLAASLAAPALAQGPGFGGSSPPPEMMAKIKAWQQWRGTHKHVETLQQTLRGLTAVEQDPKTQMTKPQARAALAVLRTWSGKPSITDAQALAINKKLTDNLTLPQLQKYAAATARRGGRGGGEASVADGRAVAAALAVEVAVALEAVVDAAASTRHRSLRPTTTTRSTPAPSRLSARARVSRSSSKNSRWPYPAPHVSPARFSRKTPYAVLQAAD